MPIAGVHTWPLAHIPHHFYPQCLHFVYSFLPCDLESFRHEVILLCVELLAYSNGVDVIDAKQQFGIEKRLQRVLDP